ncbi:hypothetical protein C8Q77DRAFT_1047001 [Trametes polyzona]|nr:hypothetical protein C8Q77DRAFT_1047001 [Trametes polyzona]
MLSILALAASVGSTMASFTPTAPGPGDTFAAGSDCTIKWAADTSGHWTNVSIYLMSGSNNNMSRVTTVTFGLDGSDPDLSPYKWTCPDVDPYSAIYFYQFTNGDDEQDSMWTTRFTITSPDGDSDDPEHSTQPGGDSIPWGEGHLASENKAAAYGSSSKDVDQEATSDADHVTQQGDDEGEEDDTDAAPTTRTRKHSTTEDPSGTPAPSTSGTASPSHNRSIHSIHPTSSGEAAEQLVPTASLPSKKARVSRSGSPSSSMPTSSGMPCTEMGPGMPQMGGMKLASGARRRGAWWPRIVSVYPVFLAMLL